MYFLLETGGFPAHVHRDTLTHRDTPIGETPNLFWNKLFVHAYTWYPTHLSIYASCARLKPKSMLIYAHGLMHPVSANSVSTSFCPDSSLYSSIHFSISSSIWKFCSTWLWGDGEMVRCDKWYGLVACYCRSVLLRQLQRWKCNINVFKGPIFHLNVALGDQETCQPTGSAGAIFSRQR